MKLLEMLKGLFKNEKYTLEDEYVHEISQQERLAKKDDCVNCTREVEKSKPIPKAKNQKGYYKVTIPGAYRDVAISDHAIKQYRKYVKDAEKLTLDEVLYKIAKMYAFSKTSYIHENKFYCVFYDMVIVIKYANINHITDIWRMKKGQYQKYIPNAKDYKEWQEEYPIENFKDGIIQ